jgi:hypothetical protein
MQKTVPFQENPTETSQFYPNFHPTVPFHFEFIKQKPAGRKFDPAKFDPAKVKNCVRSFSRTLQPR